MTIRIGVVMDAIETINFKKDTTLGLMWAAQDRGHSLFYMQQRDLYLEDGKARASMTPIHVDHNPQQFFHRQETVDQALGDLDVILMRKDPPFDNEYIYTTYILEAAEREGVLVVNKPQSLRDCNEKLFATQFPQCCPPLVVSRNPKRLRAFHAEHQDVIFKPLDGMGGSAIFRVRADDPNLGVILETLTDHGRQTIMGQRYLSAIKEGDKRILMVNGEPIPYCLARIPAQGETRGNLAAGGSGRPQPLSDRDRWIAEQVGPTLREKGLFFVGLDVIGDYLTEINVTSPTCLREISDHYQIDIASQLFDAIEMALRDH